MKPLPAVPVAQVAKVAKLVMLASDAASDSDVMEAVGAVMVLREMSRYRQSVPDVGRRVVNPTLGKRKRRVRSQGARFVNCGTCLNCLDKPKFGGAGVRKQACVQQVVDNPLT